MFKAILFFALVAFAASSLVGDFKDIDVNDEEVVAASKAAARSLSLRNISPYHSKLVKVLEAKVQVVAGKNFKLKVIMGATNCEKRKVKYDNIDDCEFRDTQSTYKKCTAVVYKPLNKDHRVIGWGCGSISKDELEF